MFPVAGPDDRISCDATERPMMPANNRMANILVSDKDVANSFVAFLTDESGVE